MKKLNMSTRYQATQGQRPADHTPGSISLEESDAPARCEKEQGRDSESHPEEAMMKSRSSGVQEVRAFRHVLATAALLGQHVRNVYYI